MMIRLRFLCLMLGVGNAFAQAPAALAPAAPGAEKRRTELRDALRGARAAELQQLPASQAKPVQRQLSPQERADLRHQLREHVPQNKPERH